MIYAIRVGNKGPIKIGFTRSRKTLSGRMSALQTGAPKRLSVLALTEGDRRDEQRIHGLLVKHREHGEWFTPAGHVHRMVALLKQSVDATDATCRYKSWAYIDGKRASNPLSRSFRKKLRKILQNTESVEEFKDAAMSAGYSSVDIDTFAAMASH